MPATIIHPFRPPGAEIDEDVFLCPLELWRDPERRIDEAALHEVSRTLARLHVLHEPQWREAIGENVAAAVGIGMRNLIAGRDGALGLLDVVMSAVLLHAERGNGTARIILHHGRRSL